MTRSVIVSTVRTPFGRLGGGLAGHPATELGSIAIRAGLERAGIEPDRGRLRRDGPGAPGRRRPGAGPPGGGRRGHPEGSPRRHDQQGLRLVDQGDRAGRPDDPRRPARRRRDRRDGVDVERAVPAAEGALRLPPRQRRGDRSHGVRRAHVDVRRRPHGRPGLARRARARDLARSRRTHGRRAPSQRAAAAQDAGGFAEEIVPVGELDADEGIRRDTTSRSSQR